MAELFTEVYNLLPLAHRINNKVLVSKIYPLDFHFYVMNIMRLQEKRFCLGRAFHLSLYALLR